jgi:hypothetical protein
LGVAQKADLIDQIIEVGAALMAAGFSGLVRLRNGHHLYLF